MSYNTFDKQKDSQINWVGDIPSHWLTSKIKNNFTFSKSTNTSKNPTILSLTLQGIKIRDITTNEGQIASSYDNYTKVYKNDIVMNPMDLISGFVDCSPVEGVISPAYYTLKPNKDIDPEYYKYYLQKHYYEKIFFPFAEGVSVDHRWTLKKEDFINFSIIKPPLDEQKQIANYLDKKTSKIDTIIAKNKELITLLEEKRTALINQVVTKGLNPEVPMKESGIEWIGEIPEHWETNKIKNMSYVKGRIGWHGLTSEEYSDEGAYLVTGTDFEEGTVDWNHCNHISYERYKQDPNIHLKEGDLLITKDGTIGKLALIKNIPDKATLNSGIFLVRPLKDNYTNEYLYWVLSSDIFTRFFDYIKTGATIAHLYQETFERFFFPYMDINEQNKIVDFLNINISKINFTIKKVEENIGLLEEYKTSLIHHVVTGKIDVRGEEI